MSKKTAFVGFSDGLPHTRESGVGLMMREQWPYSTCADPEGAGGLDPPPPRADDGPLIVVFGSFPS